MVNTKATLAISGARALGVKNCERFYLVLPAWRTGAAVVDAQLLTVPFTVQYSSREAAGVSCRRQVSSILRLKDFSALFLGNFLPGPGRCRKGRNLVHLITKGLVFFFSLIGSIPLAERLGYATEQLGCYTGPTVSGLLNATFGNAMQMIVSICALKKGMIRIAQQSLLGFILSNMLMVLGCAFFCGGFVHHHKVQLFNKAAATVNSGLLLMAVMCILLPAVLQFTHTEVHKGNSDISLSRFTSCIMLIAYSSYLFFLLKSQDNLYSSLDEVRDNGEGPDEDNVPEINPCEAIGWFAFLTLYSSLLSGYLVDAVQGASDSLNLPVPFISVILLPIVGNTASFFFLTKDKLDITIGFAIGSSTQISMFVIPVCVIVGWIMGQPMDLNFQLFETAILIIAVLLVAFMLQDGHSHYFKGLMLILCYLIIAASFFVHVDSTKEHD